MCLFYNSSFIYRLTGNNLISSHTVYTGVVILYRGESISFTETTKVFMEKLSEEEILAYVETGESM